MFKLLRKFVSNLAIDLGTANTVVWDSRKGLIINEPSVVAVMETGKGVKKVVAVGEEAKKMMGRSPQDIKVIRPLKDGVIADFEVAEAMLTYFIRKAVRVNTFIKPTVVIGVPSGITSVEKKAVIESGLGAGASEVYLIQEPMASAIGIGLPVDKPIGNMIADIGGGTTEVAVISLSGIVVSTSIKIAGDEMDEAIVNFLRKTKNLVIGYTTAESIKIQIGAAKVIEPKMSMEVKGIDIALGVPRNTIITQEDIASALEGVVAQIVKAVRETLEKTPPELAADIFERGIYLAGGGSLLRGIDKAIEEDTGIKTFVAEEPLLAVVKGCAKTLEDIHLLRRINYA